MTTDKDTIKIIFGLVIFMFSLALAYFSASYIDSQGLFDYWTTLLISAGVYIIFGAMVYGIFSVSLGFLFSADILILHLLFENFGTIPGVAKTTIVGVIIIILMLLALDMEDSPDQPMQNPNL
jgi:hypothetical protein